MNDPDNFTQVKRYFSALPPKSNGKPWNLQEIDFTTLPANIKQMFASGSEPAWDSFVRSLMTGGSGAPTTGGGSAQPVTGTGAPPRVTPNQSTP